MQYFTDCSRLTKIYVRYLNAKYLSDRELVITLCHGATACVSGYTARSPKNWDLQQNTVTSYWFAWECLEEEEGSRQNRHGVQIKNALS